MKKSIITIAFTALFILFAYNGFSQPAPPTGAGHGATSNQTGGSAPIGGGLFILLGLGAAYGGKKLYNMNKEELED